MPWDDKNVSKLRELWDQGLPTAQIGKLLGFTKNAVVGKVRRLDLAMRRAPAQPKREPNVVTLDRLKANQCSWPEGEPGKDDFRFCGNLALNGKPYCEKHCAVAYVPPKKKQSANAA